MERSASPVIEFLIEVRVKETRTARVNCAYDRRVNKARQRTKRHIPRKTRAQTAILQGRAPRRNSPPCKTIAPGAFALSRLANEHDRPNEVKMGLLDIGDSDFRSYEATCLSRFSSMTTCVCMLGRNARFAYLLLCE